MTSIPRPTAFPHLSSPSASAQLAASADASPSHIPLSRTVSAPGAPASAEQGRRKPGRKAIEEPPANDKIAAARRAQRQFRERRANEVAELKRKVEELTEEVQIGRELREEVIALRAENSVLKQMATFSFVAPIGSSSSLLNLQTPLSLPKSHGCGSFPATPAFQQLPQMLPPHQASGILSLLGQGSLLFNSTSLPPVPPVTTSISQPSSWRGTETVTATEPKRFRPSDIYQGAELRSEAEIGDLLQYTSASDSSPENSTVCGSAAADFGMYRSEQTSLKISAAPRSPTFEDLFPDVCIKTERSEILATAKVEMSKIPALEPHPDIVDELIDAFDKMIALGPVVFSKPYQQLQDLEEIKVIGAVKEKAYSLCTSAEEVDSIKTVFTDAKDKLRPLTLG